VLTKNFTVFIKFWRFNAFLDEAFTVTSRSKTIAALRLCVLDGNGNSQTPKMYYKLCKIYAYSNDEKNDIILVYGECFKKASLTTHIYARDTWKGKRLLSGFLKDWRVS
jgi:hypothetical protein